MECHHNILRCTLDSFVCVYLHCTSLTKPQTLAILNSLLSTSAFKQPNGWDGRKRHLLCMQAHKSQVGSQNCRTILLEFSVQFPVYFVKRLLNTFSLQTSSPPSQSSLSAHHKENKSKWRTVSFPLYQIHQLPCTTLSCSVFPSVQTMSSSCSF